MAMGLQQGYQRAELLEKVEEALRPVAVINEIEHTVVDVKWRRVVKAVQEAAKPFSLGKRLRHRNTKPCEKKGSSF